MIPQTSEHDSLLFIQEGKSANQLFPIEQEESSAPQKKEDFTKPVAGEEHSGKKKKRKKEEVQTMKIVKKDNKDELCMQEYEDLCYTPIRVDTIEMGSFSLLLSLASTVIT